MDVIGMVYVSGRGLGMGGLRGFRKNTGTVCENGTRSKHKHAEWKMEAGRSKLDEGVFERRNKSDKKGGSV